MSHAPGLRWAPLWAGLAVFAAAGAAHAHARLVASAPAAQASGPAPTVITLKMSEAPMAKFSGVELTSHTGAPLAVKPVKVADRKTLAVAPGTPLKQGVYTVKWHAVAADMHRTQGAFSFTVR